MARRLLEPRLRMAHASRSARRGFTLVELAIVVAIVGVLAVLAVVGYRKLTLNAKISEAKTTIGAIRIAQDDYRFAEGSGKYANVAGGYCPGTGLALPIVKTQWDPGCGGAIKWGALAVHVDGPVQFGYHTDAGGFIGGAAAPTGYGFVNVGAIDTAKPWYEVHARADLNGDPADGFTQASSNSGTNVIFVEQKTEGN